MVAHLDRVFLEDAQARAFVFLEDGDKPSAEYTRGRLREASLSLAAALQAQDAPGERALLLYPSGPEYVRAYLACLYAGVVPVPCYPPARQRVDRRLEAIARTADARFVLTTDRIAAAGQRHNGDIPQLGNASWVATDTIDESGASNWSAPDIGPETIALLQFTSGSTSAPRGVMVTHRNLLASFEDMAWRWDHDASSVLVTWLPLFHDMGLIYTMLQPIAGGFLGVMMSPAAFLQRPMRWLQAISTYRGTHSAAPNFAYDLCVSRVPANAMGTLDLSSWRVAINGAEPVRAETVSRFTKHFAPAGLNVHTLSQGYGLAEATLRVSMTPGDESPRIFKADPVALAARRVRAAATPESGRPLVSGGLVPPATRVTIVDPATGLPCAADKVGEIWVEGRTVAAGYFRDPEATRAAFQGRIPNEAGSFLRTGDLGFLLDGELYVAGRLKDIIIVGGLNHYPQDLEQTAETSHPGLAPGGCAAFSIDGPDGEGLAIVAEVDRATRRQWQVEDLIDALRRALPIEHGIAPSVVAILAPRRLPKTSSGKVQRSECRRRLLSGELSPLGIWRRPSSAGEATGATTPALPARDIEAWLVSRYASRLGVAADTIDTTCSLDELGLDSVEAVTLAGELETLVGRSLPPTFAYDYPSINALAATLSTDRESQTAETVLHSASHGHRGSPSLTSGAIAIIGMACRFPGAASPEAFWRLLSEGRSAVSTIPPARWAVPNEPTGDIPVSRHGGFVNAIDRFDAAFFSIAPREALWMDPQQRILLELAWEVLERAGIAPDSLAGSRTGVFVGVSNSDYARLILQHGEPDNIYAGTGGALSICANRLSYMFDLKGPSLAVDTACSSSLVSVALACDSLRRGQSTLALAGGANVLASSDYTVAFSAAGMMAHDGRCKAFDASADGYVRGEGAGLLVLKRLEDAEQDGDSILAIVRGAAVTQDGRTAGLTAPNGPSQQAVVRAALADARISAAQIGYVEAHGTGTALGDPIEVNALAEVLADGRAPDAACLIGSVKTNIGHLESAAGIAGVIKTVLALQHQAVPASLHFKELNPAIDLGQTLRIATDSRPWPSDGNTRRAGVSSFGFGGTNAHVVLEEYPAQRSAVAMPTGPFALTLSARDHQALTDLAERHVTRLHDLSPELFGNVCWTSNTARTEFSERVCVVADAQDNAAQALRAWRNGETPVDGVSVVEGSATAETPGIAFLYTGQGGQVPGMGHELFSREPVFQAAIAECDEAVGDALGQSLVSVLYGEQPSALTDMHQTQTTVFALQYALTCLWRSWDVVPAAAIGHSLGEFAAACAAGVMNVSDAIRLVQARGALLQSITADGVMVAAMAPPDMLADAIRPWETTLSIAAINGPRNVVFAGARPDADEATSLLSSMGIKCTVLSIAQASHSPLVDPVLEAFEAAASRVEYRAPQLPLISNVTGTWLQDAPEPQYWRRHLRQTVRFANGLNTLRGSGYRLFLEIGPHPTLSILGEQLDEGGAAWTSTLHRERPDREQMLTAAATLWAHGATINWTRSFGNTRPDRVGLPTYPFQRKSFWIEHRAVPPMQDAVLTELPGREMPIASPTAPRIFEARLTANDAPTGAHMVNGGAWLSSATFISAAIAAAQCHGSVSIRDLEWLRALALPQHESVEVQMTCSRGSLPARIELHSRDNGAHQWTQHAACSIVPVERPSAEPLKCSDGRAMSSDAFYAQLAERGVELVPQARLLAQIEIGANSATAEFDLSESADQSWQIVEAATQCAAAAVLSDQRPLVLSSAASITLKEHAGHCVVTATRRSEVPTVVDVEVTNGHQTVATLEGLVFRQVVPAFNEARDLYSVEWLRDERPLTHATECGGWIILSAARVEASALVDALEASGARATHIDTTTCHDRKSYVSALDDGRTRLDMDPVGVVVLRPGSGLPVVLALQALLPRTWQARIWVVTENATAATGGPILSSSIEGGAWGIGRTIALEHPRHWGGLIDGDPTALAAGADIAGELTRARSTDDQVALREGRCYVPRLTRTQTTDNVSVRNEATYLITGGRGALGIALARTLTDAGATHLVLAGRTPILDDETAAAISALRDSGTTVDLVTLDVRNADACRQLIDRCDNSRRPLAGVFHTAGVGARGSLLELTPSAFSDAFDAKALGTLNLASATEQLPLDFFVCVTSMVSTWGGTNQAAYVAANAAADAVTAALARRGRKALSVGLGPLAGGMLPSDVARSMQRLGVRTWSMDTAGTLLLALAASPQPNLVAASIDWQRFLPAIEAAGPRAAFDRVRGREPERAPLQPSTNGALADSLIRADPEVRPALLLATIKQHVATVLGLDTAEAIEPQRGFFDIGMDSMTALELRRRLEHSLGQKLPATLVFDHPNVDMLHGALAQALVKIFEGSAIPCSTPPSSSDQPEPVPASVSVSEDEFESTLSRLERLVEDR